jgi:hypothetical protein
VDIIILLDAETMHALITLLVCVDNSLITVPPNVVTHIQQVIPEFMQQGFSMNYMSSNERTRHALEDPQTLTALLNNTALQEILKDEDNNNQDLISIMYHLVKAGSRYNDETQPETKHHLAILESVSGIPDCLFFHLRNHPSLFCGFDS